MLTRKAVHGYGGCVPPSHVWQGPGQPAGVKPRPLKRAGPCVGPRDRKGATLPVPLRPAVRMDRWLAARVARVALRPRAWLEGPYPPAGLQLAEGVGGRAVYTRLACPSRGRTNMFTGPAMIDTPRYG
jgi:hypothetical protein